MGGKVNLAYGGQYQEERRYGISAENGGGSRNIPEDKSAADALAKRHSIHITSAHFRDNSQTTWTREVHGLKNSNFSPRLE